MILENGIDVREEVVLMGERIAIGIGEDQECGRPLFLLGLESSVGVEFLQTCSRTTV